MIVALKLTELPSQSVCDTGCVAISKPLGHCPLTSTPKELTNKKTKAVTLPLKGNSLNTFSRKGLSEMIFEFSIVNAHVYKPTRL